MSGAKCNSGSRAILALRRRWGRDITQFDRPGWPHVRIRSPRWRLEDSPAQSVGTVRRAGRDRKRAVGATSMRRQPRVGCERGG
jgi:hypothetical protein